MSCSNCVCRFELDHHSKDIRTEDQLDCRRRRHGTAMWSAHPHRGSVASGWCLADFCRYVWGRSRRPFQRGAQLGSFTPRVEVLADLHDEMAFQGCELRGCHDLRLESSGERAGGRPTRAWSNSTHTNEG